MIPEIKWKTGDWCKEKDVCNFLGVTSLAHPPEIRIHPHAESIVETFGEVPCPKCGSHENTKLSNDPQTGQLRLMCEACLKMWLLRVESVTLEQGEE